MIKKVAISLVCIFFLVSCEDRYETINTCIALPNQNTHQADTIINDSVSGHYFSRLTQAASGGLQCAYILPSEYKTNELEIVFSGRIRTNYVMTNANICVSTVDEDGKIISWNGQSLRYYTTDINKWVPFKDSIHLKPESWNKPFHSINTFAFLGESAKESADFDSLQVQVKIKR